MITHPGWPVPLPCGRPLSGSPVGGRARLVFGRAGSGRFRRLVRISRSMQLPQLTQRRTIAALPVTSRSVDIVRSGISNPPQRGQDAPGEADTSLRWPLFRSGV